MHLPFLDFCDGQQILHQIDEPHGVVVDVRKGLHPFLLVHFLIAGQQAARVAGNGSQRGTQIVGNCP